MWVNPNYLNPRIFINDIKKIKESNPNKAILLVGCRDWQVRMIIENKEELSKFCIVPYIDVDILKVAYLILPIAVLIISTLIFDVDMAIGVLVTMAFMFVYYLVKGLMSAEEFVDYSLEGLKNMILPLLLMVLAFVFADVNSQIHFTLYVIETATKLVTPAMLPLVVFIALSVTEFITGTNWGMYIIALPIVIPLAMATGANITLAVAAVLSAGVFGSHICFYSDATVITSAATGCNNMDHAVTQLPYGLLSAGISGLMFLAAGFMFN